MKVGVISDTHGLLRPEAVVQLRGCARIIHAGDLGKEEILVHLQQIAPTLAVRGNVDRGNWTERLPWSEMVLWEGVTIHVIHDVNALNFEPAKDGVGVVISGHSHQAKTERKAGVTYLNPGSIGPRRFRLPVTMAFLHFNGTGGFRIEALTLAV